MAPDFASDAETAQRCHRHWRRSRRLTLVLALVWFTLTFGTIFFARELAQLTLFGWNLSFLLAAQGALLLYLALVGGYALAMRRLDRELADGGSGDAP